MSSAYLSRKLLEETGLRSAPFMTKIGGPIAEPWKTLALILTGGEIELRYFVT